ncbi:MAG: phage integrase SAM-like domain-containing protein [Bacteroidales bacterium]
MPTVKLLLQSPHKPLTEREKEAKKRKEKIERKPAEKATRIYAYLILSRDEIIKIKTEHVIKPTEWDFDKQLKKERLAGAIEYNRRLLTLKDDLLNRYFELKDDPAKYTFDHVKQLMKVFGKTKENPFVNKTKSFFEVFDEFLISQGGSRAPRTIMKFNTLLSTLKELAESKPEYEQLTFNKIDHAFMDDFTYFLRSRAPRGRQKTRPEELQTGLLNDSIGKYIQTLKYFLKWAEQRGYNNNHTYKEFKRVSPADKKRIKRKNDIVTLTAQELRSLYTHEFEKGSTLDRVRDLFCFGCYTGQRWGDISRFKKTDLDGDIWTFITDKTKEEISIDLIGYAAPALDILKKYDYKLPKISLQKFNLYIKDAAAAAGIDTPYTLTRYSGIREIKITNPKYKWLGSHCARRTCVSLLLNVYNIPITAVMEITGHEDLKTLMAYINTDRAARREKMSKTKPVTEMMTVIKQEAV